MCCKNSTCAGMNYKLHHYITAPAWTTHLAPPWFTLPLHDKSHLMPPWSIPWPMTNVTPAWPTPSSAWPSPPLHDICHSPPLDPPHPCMTNTPHPAWPTTLHPPHHTPPHHDLPAPPLYYPPHPCMAHHTLTNATPAYPTPPLGHFGHKSALYMGRISVSGVCGEVSNKAEQNQQR